MTLPKHIRMRDEYSNQCQHLYGHEAHFRKIGRQQIQERALRLNKINHTNGDLTDVIRKGTKALVMTDELCGLFYKINRCRKMLNMDEVQKPRELLL